MRALLPEEQEFWEKHKHLIPAQMAEAARKAKLDHFYLANRLKSYLKGKEKLPTLSAHEDLIWPDPVNIEQSSSEATAAYKATHFAYPKVIDLTGGFGIDTWAFAQQAQKVLHNEPNEILSGVCRANFQKLNFQNIDYSQKDALDLLSQLPPSEGDTLVYADPSRRDEKGRRQSLLSQYVPDPSELIRLSLSLHYPLLLKLSPMDSLPEMMGLWPQLTEIHVVSVKNECKEILVFLKPNSNQPLKITAAEIGYNSLPFVFSPEEEAAASMLCGALSIYLYDPFVSILKAGPYKLLASAFGLTRLHPFTHLYTSAEHIDQFPGRQFKVLKALPASTNQLLNWFPEKKALIVTRNFPISPEKLYLKLKLQPGGERFLFALTDHRDQRLFVIAERIK
jgi:hypothetical protein